MNDLVCITVKSKPNEPPAEFAARLSRFWTHMLRAHKDEFEKVYAETTAFEEDDDALTRQYLVEPNVVALLERELRAAGVAHAPIDLGDLFSKYEATPPEWMQIEH